MPWPSLSDQVSSAYASHFSHMLHAVGHLEIMSNKAKWASLSQSS